MWLHSVGGIWVFSGLASLNAETVKSITESSGALGRSKEVDVCSVRVLTSHSGGEAKKACLTYVPFVLVLVLEVAVGMRSYTGGALLSSGSTGGQES